MSLRILLFRFALLTTLVLVSIPGVSGWTLQSWQVTPAGSELPPGTMVNANYSIHFDSWMTGSTFPKDNSLLMYTDLANPQWTLTKIEPMDGQPPIIEQVPVRQAAQIRVDGWTLSYSRKQYDLSVQVSGRTPALNQSGTISIVKLQENTGGAKLVAGSLTKKEVRILVPTPVPTLVPAEMTLNLTPVEIIEVTPEPKASDIPLTPTKKVTYSPGPEPVLIVGLLVGLVMITRCAGRKE